MWEEKNSIKSLSGVLTIKGFFRHNKNCTYVNFALQLTPASSHKRFHVLQISNLSDSVNYLEICQAEISQNYSMAYFWTWPLYKCFWDFGLCVFLEIHVQNQGYEVCVTAQVTITVLPTVISKSSPSHFQWQLVLREITFNRPGQTVHNSNTLINVPNV